MRKKYKIPEIFPFQEARKLFHAPAVHQDNEVIKKTVTITQPKEDELRKWLIETKGFN